MVIAALICFATLLIAWILAPEERASSRPVATIEAEPVEAESLPVAA